MKKTKTWVVLASMLVPGYFACSCTGNAAMRMRDAVLAGASTFVEATTLDLLLISVPIGDDADE